MSLADLQPFLGSIRISRNVTNSYFLWFLYKTWYFVCWLMSMGMKLNFIVSFMWWWMVL